MIVSTWTLLDPKQRTAQCRAFVPRRWRFNNMLMITSPSLPPVIQNQESNVTVQRLSRDQSRVFAPGNERHSSLVFSLIPFAASLSSVSTALVQPLYIRLAHSSSLTSSILVSDPMERHDAPQPCEAPPTGLDSLHSCTILYPLVPACHFSCDATIAKTGASRRMQSYYLPRPVCTPVRAGALPFYTFLPFSRPSLSSYAPLPFSPLSNGLPGWPDERRQGQNGQKTKLDWILFLLTVDMTSVRTLPEAQRPGRPLRLEPTHPPARLTMQPLGLSCFSSSLPPTLKHEMDPRCANLTRPLAVHDRCRRCGDGGGVS